MITIQKVKYSEANNKIVIEYERTIEDKPSHHLSSFEEEAAPEFYKALAGLTKPVLNILGLPATDTSVVINTPLMRCPCDEQEAEQLGFFNQETVDALWAVEQETRKFLDGKRAQIMLFADEVNESDDTDKPIVTPNNVVALPTMTQ